MYIAINIDGFCIDENGEKQDGIYFLEEKETGTFKEDDEITIYKVEEIKK
jgi:hypothetical protein